LPQTLDYLNCCPIVPQAVIHNREIDGRISRDRQTGATHEERNWDEISAREYPGVEFQVRGIVVHDENSHFWHDKVSLKS